MVGVVLQSFNLLCLVGGIECHVKLVQEVFLTVVVAPNEPLWSNVNCESALTHQILCIPLRDPAPLNTLHSTKVKPRTPKYKEARYITGISMCQGTTPTYPGRSIDTKQSEGQVGHWLTGVSCQDPAAIKSSTELHM